VPIESAEPDVSPSAPLHVACIMDGNGRWAARRGLPRTEGHTEGEENLARVVRIAVRRNIGWLTVFGFST
jgi:undecaprenyl diphosphate synthase